MEPKDSKPKTIFEYDNYREYLKDFYSTSKASDKKFSFRYFARLAGCKSSATLKRVMDGHRNLTEDGIEKFAKGLKLKKEEAAFFRNLVGLNQAKTAEEGQHYAREILHCESYRKIHSLDESQFNFYMCWYLTAVRELICLPDFREDYSWIAKKLVPCISAREAKHAVNELLKLGLIQRDRNGKLVQTHSLISTQNQVSSVAIAQYHREMMKRASESIDRFPREDRAILAQTLGVSRKTAEKIKEVIQKFREEVFETVSHDEGVEVIYQLNFQLFPLMDLPAPIKEEA